MMTPVVLHVQRAHSERERIIMNGTPRKILSKKDTKRVGETRWLARQAVAGLQTLSREQRCQA